MHLEVSTPLQVLVDARIAKVSAEGLAGSFTLLPHHMDFLTALTPGILTYVTEEGQTRYLAVDKGVLVKTGNAVRVATRQAVIEQDLARLQGAVAQEFENYNAAEAEARSALHKLEADVVREFWQLEQQRHGR